jgi:hypothetical protein
MSIAIVTILAFSMGFILALILVAIGLHKKYIKIITMEEKYFNRIKWITENYKTLKDFHERINIVIMEYQKENQLSKLRNV